MTNRIVRDAILDSERVDRLDPPAEVFYRRLMNKVDDFGLFDARPTTLRTSLYPLRIDRVREADISRWIAECVKAGLIALYVADGKPYGQMIDTRWSVRSEPKFPKPPWWGKEPPRGDRQEGLNEAKDVLAWVLNSIACSGSQAKSTAPVFVDVGVDVDVTPQDASRLAPPVGPKVDPPPAPPAPPAPPPPPPDPPAGEKAKRASKRAPADFAIDADMRQWASQHCPSIDVDGETDALRDHTFGVARSDWVATWRNWMRKAENDHKRRHGRGSVVTKPAWKQEQERRAAELGGRRTPPQGGEVVGEAVEVRDGA